MSWRLCMAGLSHARSARLVFASRTRPEASLARHDVSRRNAFVVDAGTQNWLSMFDRRLIMCL